MAGQGPSRRELLQALSLAATASAFPGFARWSYALKEDAQAVVLPAYRPQFFSAPQYQTIEALAEMILPAMHDASGKPQPGAKEAGVAEFIDFMVASDVEMQQPFIAGLQWLDDAAKPNSTFLSLDASQKQALLERLAYKAKQRPEEKSGQAFFLLMRRMTVTGFYTSRLGLESLDYPGLRFYTTSPGCDHPGNPEHVGL